MKPYFNDALIGNSCMLATLDKRGKFLRIFWPDLDFKQLLQEYRLGIHIDDIERTIDIFEECNETTQQYLANSNILETVITLKRYGIKVRFLDLISIDKDVIIRKMQIKNELDLSRKISLLSLTSMVKYGSDIACSLFDSEESAAIHYIHDHYMAIRFDSPIDSFQIGVDLDNEFFNNDIKSFDKIGMVPQILMRKDLGEIGKFSEITIDQYISFAADIRSLKKEIADSKENDSDNVLNNTLDYWNDFVKNAIVPDIDHKEIRDIFIRSILLFGLVSDKKNGGILASAEIDEDFTKSGRYAYCWGRDAAFITEAFDTCGLYKQADKFFEWAEKTQGNDGSWYQRYYLDGNLAPSWGFQIDETGSILYGIYKHCLAVQESNILRKHYSMIKKAADFLCTYIDPETGLPRASYDLWEERIGIHAYSNAAVFSGLKAACNLSDMLKIEEPDIEKWKKTYEEIKSNTEKFFWKADYKRFIRSISIKNKYFDTEIPEDWKFDISILGISYPFEMFEMSDDKINSTFGYLEAILRDDRTGNLRRYEEDHYICGNPWTLATLWAGMFLACKGDTEKARGYLFNAIKGRNALDYLPEQIDPQTLSSAWVIPLTWSHAVFVLLVREIFGK